MRVTMMGFDSPVGCPHTDAADHRQLRKVGERQRQLMFTASSGRQHRAVEDDGLLQIDDE